jgi:hypothetical protein
MTGYDDFQVIPHQVGDIVGGEKERPLGSRLSNYQAMFKGNRKSQDYTLTTFTSGEDQHRNPQKGYIEHGWDVNDAYLGHGTDWSLFEYNPYGHSKDAAYKNPRLRRLSGDWATIIGFGSVSFEDEDVIGGNVHNNIIQYRNYPDEGYSSYGKKSSGASGDKRWAWKGNTWVPAA